MIGNFSCSVHYRRIFLNYILSAVIFFLFSIILYTYFQENSKLLSSIQKSPQRSFSKSFHDIKGFNYTRTEHGQHIFSIIADSFDIIISAMTIAQNREEEVNFPRSYIEYFPGSGKHLGFAIKEGEMPFLLRLNTFIEAIK